MKNLFVYLLVLLFFLNANFLLAQVDKDPTQSIDPFHLSETGQMFSIKITPGEKSSRLYIVGKEFAEIKVKDLKLEAKLFVDGKEKTISWKRNKDHFILNSSLKGETLNLKVEESTTPGKSEELKIKLKQP